MFWDSFNAFYRTQSRYFMWLAMNNVVKYIGSNALLEQHFAMLENSMRRTLQSKFKWNFVFYGILHYLWKLH